MKTLYESILDMDEKKSDLEALRYTIEKETGWTLSPDGKYILSGTMWFTPEISDTEWFEKLIICAKKYKLKIQPFGKLIIKEQDVYLLENDNIEYICELDICCQNSNPVNINLSKIKTPIHRLYIEDTGYRKNSVPGNIILPKSIKTAFMSLTDRLEGELEYKNLNCENLIIYDTYARLWNKDYNNLKHMQYIVNNNPEVSNFYIAQGGSHNKYHQAKLKGRNVVGIMGKSEGALLSKGVLEDFNQKNADYREWYEKHM